MDEQHTGGRRPESGQVRFDDRRAWWSARARDPMRAWAFVRLHRSLVATWLLLLVGFAVQVVVILVVAYLVDLCISLFELWAELARKHLELTLFLALVS